MGSERMFEKHTIYLLKAYEIVSIQVQLHDCLNCTQCVVVICLIN